MTRPLIELKAALTDDQLIEAAKLIKNSGNLVATRHFEHQHGYSLQEARMMTGHIAEFLASWKRS
ncbi:hypothetical protein D1872_72870 [compost metagenome]